MVKKDFLEYIENAEEQYRQYQALDKEEKFSFQEFLTIIEIWKLEEILEKLDDFKN